MIRLFLLLLALVVSPLVNANGKILVFGDSLSAGFGLQTGEGWVDLLQQRLLREKLDYKVINASISGDTTDNGLSRLPRTLADNAPDIVILELGANDGLRGLSLKSMKNNLSKMIDLCQSNDAKVLLVGMQMPPNYGVFYARSFSNTYSDLAKEKNIPLLPFLLDGFESDMSYFQADRIHPNKQAQPFIVENIWRKLLPLL